jgi:Zn-dependent peptidase ImmA (M78 family)
MNTVWERVEAERLKYEACRNGDIPVDVFTLAEVDLRLDIIPFPDLDAKYRVAAGIKADFSGIYVDEREYVFWENGPVWKTKRLRFSVAHELGHFFLHRSLPQAKNFGSVPEFARWSESYDGRMYSAEEEANEFAGRLLVPRPKLEALVDELDAKLTAAGLHRSAAMRQGFCASAEDKFLVSDDVIAVRLDREVLWPAT